jgi:hemoglobin
MKKDITDEHDIRALIDAFYLRVRQDDVIGHIFNDIANVDWEHHLPKMYAFWSFLLLGKDAYRGNPFDVHQKLNKKVLLTGDHFNRWIKIFTETVDENFSGLRAEEAKNKAKLIALTWQPKFKE